DCTAACSQAADLAARRAHERARRAVAAAALGLHARAPYGRRARTRRHPWIAGHRRNTGAAPERARAGAAIVSALAALLVRDLRIAMGVGGGALIVVLFFLVVVPLVPFALGPDLALLKRIGPAILWLAALLASLLALDRLFAVDHEDGSLDLLLMSRAPLEL